MIVEIVFAAGCFWGVEKHFESMDGVVEVVSGYTGGNYANPTYQEVLRYRAETNSDIINHTEAVKVKFDNEKITSKELIKSFWELHDPTQKNRQGNDIGNNYRSGIFYTNENQKNIAYNTKATYQTLLEEHGFGKIVTQIEPLSNFYEAEKYHQDYLAKNPNGYCPNHSTGVKFEKQNDETKREVFAYRGFLEKEKFYQLLGEFKLGKDSQSYNVAFGKGTDSRFCQQYDIFKETPDGVFVDKLSGDILFDTKERFNSGTGWLSFYKAVDGSTIEKEDNSHGMNRIEVLAKKSGIHLGHVFPRVDGKRRFCINATVLDFIPREKIKK